MPTKWVLQRCIIVHFTLQRDKEQHEPDSDDGRPADLKPHEVCDDDGGQRSYPQVVQEDDGHVETVHVIWQEIHYLADCRLAERCFWQP